MPLHSEAMSVLGPYDAFHSLERLVESGCLDREDDQVDGRRLARADGLERAGLAIDGERIARVTLKTGVIHNVFDGVVAECLGDHTAVE